MKLLNPQALQRRQILQHLLPQRQVMIIITSDTATMTTDVPNSRERTLKINTSANNA